MTDKEKVIVITGASRGIGAAIAVLAAQKGYNVCVNYLNNKHKGEEVVEKIIQLGRQAIAVQADISQTKDIIKLFTQVDNKLGTISALVNNAAYSGPRMKLVDADEISIKRIVETSLLGSILCAKEAVKRMALSNGGSGGGIVNISSQAAYYGGNGISPYAASKAGINAMTLGLAREVANEGIRVNTVSPGIINTEFEDVTYQGDSRVESIPMLRFGQPHEVANAVLWLLSEEASYITGAVLPVTGGR